HRDDDVVAIPGKDLPRLLGEKKERLRLFAWRDGKLVAAPLQVDERTPEGRYCFDHGAQALADIDDGAVDDNDEGVLSPGHAGAGGPGGKLRRGVVGPRGGELRDARGGGRGGAYGARSGGGPRAAPAERPLFEVERGGGARWRGRGFDVAIGVRPPGNAFLGG